MNQHTLITRATITLPYHAPTSAQVRIQWDERTIYVIDALEAVPSLSYSFRGITWEFVRAPKLEATYVLPATIYRGRKQAKHWRIIVK